MPYSPVLGRREVWEDDFWSEWTRIMAPEKKSGFLRRGLDHPGYRKKDLEKDMPNICGIYELALGKRGTPPTVVYIGSTCRKKTGKILARIQEYCHDGSHKAGLINAALEEGYTIYARIRESHRDEKKLAEKDENFFLGLFDYAWNERNNGNKSRHFFP